MHVTDGPRARVALVRACAQTLRVLPTAGVYVVASARSSAAIIVPDLPAQRCVLHIVDAVLIPSTVNVRV